MIGLYAKWYILVIVSVLIVWVKCVSHDVWKIIVLYGQNIPDISYGIIYQWRNLYGD